MSQKYVAPCEMWRTVGGVGAVSGSLTVVWSGKDMIVVTVDNRVFSGAVKQRLLPSAPLLLYLDSSFFALYCFFTLCLLVMKLVCCWPTNKPSTSI